MVITVLPYNVVARNETPKLIYLINEILNEETLIIQRIIDDFCRFHFVITL